MMLVLPRLSLLASDANSMEKGRPASATDTAHAAPIPVVAVAAASAGAEKPVSPARAAPAAKRCPAWDIVAGGTPAVLAEISGIQLGVKAAVVRGGMDPEAASSVFAAVQRYGELITSLGLRNALHKCGGAFGRESRTGAAQTEAGMMSPPPPNAVVVQG